MSYINLLGLAGGACFACAGVPEAIRLLRRGWTGTPLSVALMILLGTIPLYSYLYITYGFNWVLTLNYLVEALSWAVLIYFHYMLV